MKPAEKERIQKDGKVVKEIVVACDTLGSVSM
jgi:hypothetical protein